MHFSRSGAIEALPVRQGTVEKKPESALRWLGIWLDRRLAFKVHVQKWTAKAQAVAFHLRGFVNTKHGPLPAAVRRAVRACVEPALLYGAEAWYPGPTRPQWGPGRKDTPTKIQHLVRRMQRALKTSMQAILPVWRTTPTAALHRESGIPPVRQLLEACRVRFAARIKALDEGHPLVTRTLPATQVVIRPFIKRKYQSQREWFHTRLRRTDRLVSPCPRPKLLLKDPYLEHIKPLQTAPKEESAAEFQRWLQTISSLTLVVYSDGSMSEEGTVGYGYAVHRNGMTVTSGCGRLGPAEVFDAEAKGALEGLKAALETGDPPGSPIVVCIDNLAAAGCLQGIPSDSSQEIFLEFQALASSHGATEVRWVPGHTNIPGNEEADALAKGACSLPEPADACPTLAHIRRTAKRLPKDEFRSWWNTAAPDRYKALNLDCTANCPKELLLPRPKLHHLLAARTHHGDFADYHERLNHSNVRLTCSCGRRKEPHHLFYCRKVPSRHRMRLGPSPTAIIHRAVGRDFDLFVKMAEASAFFERICLRF